MALGVTPIDFFMAKDEGERVRSPPTTAQADFPKCW